MIRYSIEDISDGKIAAWAGFDVMLMLALAATAYFAFRRPSYLPIAAGATATLLVDLAYPLLDPRVRLR